MSRVRNAVSMSGRFQIEPGISDFNGGVPPTGLRRLVVIHRGLPTTYPVKGYRHGMG
ncbi:hypothetical protein Are01nite_58820 [Actinoplanes regularis]|nr:hypothetical protein Are01nite_58820 [Actinoplanes regularis]